MHTNLQRDRLNGVEVYPLQRHLVTHYTNVYGVRIFFIENIYVYTSIFIGIGCTVSKSINSISVRRSHNLVCLWIPLYIARDAISYWVYVVHGNLARRSSAFDIVSGHSMPTTRCRNGLRKAWNFRVTAAVTFNVLPLRISMSSVRVIQELSSVFLHIGWVCGGVIHGIRNDRKVSEVYRKAIIGLCPAFSTI